MSFTSDDNTVRCLEKFRREDLNDFRTAVESALRKHRKCTLDISAAADYDNLFISQVHTLSLKKGVDIIHNERTGKDLTDFASLSDRPGEGPRKLTAFEKTVETVNGFFGQIVFFTVLSADIFFYSIKAVFSTSGRKKGSVYEQIFLMGNNAVPIVALLSFLIGLVLSLQSAAQLRQFGANIYLVDLIVIAMITEMGPMLTAIIVAGRSGSAIAAEIATMKITEELDALKVMALNPLKYVVAPKMLAMTVSLPVLTLLSNLVGIFGGFVIAVLYLDLSPDIFMNRAIQVMSLSFWRQSVLKSILFSWLIVLIGSHFGFTVKGGAEGVGKATTASVVASIFAVIMTDAFLSLIFYFEF